MLIIDGQIFARLFKIQFPHEWFKITHSVSVRITRSNSQWKNMFSQSLYYLDYVIDQ